MTVVKIDVSPVIIDWLFTKREIENLDDKNLKKLKEWRMRESQPTFAQIEKISSKMNIPLGYFFLKEAPKEECKVIKYRTIESDIIKNPSRNLVDTISQMEDIQEWTREYLISNGLESLKIVGSEQLENKIIDIANSIRNQLDIDEDWFYKSDSAETSFKILRERMANNGIIVMTNGVVGSSTNRKLDIKEFRAFTLIDEYAPLIFINNNDSKNSRLFSLLHEAIHIWLGVDNLFNNLLYDNQNNNKVEVVCNAVTSEILVPDNIFKLEWNKISRNNSHIENIMLLSKDTFKCGSIVVARKALDHKFIEQRVYDQISKEAISFYQKRVTKTKASGGNYYSTMANRIDNRFLLMLDNSTKEGKTSYTYAYRLTKTNKATFSKLLDKVKEVY